jgi:hypothetical protein
MSITKCHNTGSVKELSEQARPRKVHVVAIAVYLAAFTVLKFYGHELDASGSTTGGGVTYRHAARPPVRCYQVPL